MTVKEQDPTGLFLDIGQRVRSSGVRLSRSRKGRRERHEQGRSRKSSQWHCALQK
jgi:hypothetical protein